MPRHEQGNESRGGSKAYLLLVGFQTQNLEEYVVVVSVKASDEVFPEDCYHHNTETIHYKIQSS